MSTINITNARKDLYHLVDEVNASHEPAMIVGKKANAILLSEDDWNAIQETLYLESISGMVDSIQKNMKEPIENCIPEDMVQF